MAALTPEPNLNPGLSHDTSTRPAEKFLLFPDLIGLLHMLDEITLAAPKCQGLVPLEAYFLLL